MISPPKIIFAVAITAAMSGCVAKVEREAKPVFDTKPLDACLVMNMDLSGSFAADFGERAYPLMLQITNEFFRAQSGADTKVVLAQMSGHVGQDQVVLFEGTPKELRQRFNSPDDLSTFLLANSDPNRSPIFEAMGEAIGYVNRMPTVTKETRLLTVTISDLVESETDSDKRRAAGRVMVGELEKYQQLGGALALFYVSVGETERWQKILDRSGFQAGQYVIANTLNDNPPMPRMY
ncbi:hypothetical protein [Rhodopirellula baltica]